MRPSHLPRRCLLASVFGVSGLALVAACSNSLGLPPATSSNVVDTVTLYAFSGNTPLNTPSAYAIIGRAAVRTEQNPGFDFVFNFDSLRRPVFIPTGALGRYARADTTQPGFQYVSSTFANTTSAPTEGYVVDKLIVADSTKVIVARSHNELCPDGTTNSLYAKIGVLAVDTVALSVRFQVLADQNCGYRGLAPGIPGS